MRVLGICGSLRVGSTNLLVLEEAARLLPSGAALSWDAEQVGRLPPFNPDLDQDGQAPPAAVGAWRAALRAADAVLVSSPEYAHGVPGALKNTLDWIVSSGELVGKPTALVVAGPGGGSFARDGLRAVLEVIGAQVVAEAALVLGRSRISPDRRLVDPPLVAELARVVQALVDAVGRGAASLPAP